MFVFRNKKRSINFVVKEQRDTRSVYKSQLLRNEGDFAAGPKHTAWNNLHNYQEI